MSELKFVDLAVDYKNFIAKDSFEFLESLAPNTKPLWGIMTLQHMIEHLIYILENSSDKRKLQLMIREDQVEKSKAFLNSNRSLPINFKFPLLPSDALVALRYDSLEDAIKQLKLEVSYFLNYIESDGFEDVMHPFYGYLNRREILLFQYKHFIHHLRQFGLKL